MSTHTPRHPMPTVGIAAIFKNEGPYILEWVAACRLHGARRIYIADNSSTDGSTELLAALHRANVLVHLPFPGDEGQPPQLGAYREIMKRHGDEVDWMAFIDADEFFHFDQPGRTLPELLHALALSPGVGAVAVNWAVYGSSHQTHHGDAPVAQRFSRRALQQSHVNHHVKSLVRTQAYENTGSNPHSFLLQPGFGYAQANGEPLAHHPVHGAGLSEHIVWSPVRLNHYIVKSRHEFDTKKRRNGSAATVGRTKGDAYFRQHDQNDVEDPVSSGWLERLQREIRHLESSVPPLVLEAAAFRNTPVGSDLEEPPRGHVDQVTLDAGSLQVNGWSPLISHAGLPTLRIEWAGGCATSARLVTRERADVVRRHASVGLNCGFQAVFKLSDAPGLASNLRDCSFFAMDGTQRAALSTAGCAQWACTGETPVQSAPPRIPPDHPALPAACINLLTSALGSSRTYLEYGSGGSTLLAVRSPPAHIVSVESDAAWLKGVVDKAHAAPGARDRLHALHIDIGPTQALGYPVSDVQWRSYWQYPMAAWAHCKTLGIEPDLVLIDGRFRLACFFASLLNAPTGCRVLFDDYGDRPYYHAAARLVAPLTQIDRMAVFVIPPQRPEAADITHALVAALGDAR